MANTNLPNICTIDAPGTIITYIVRLGLLEVMATAGRPPSPPQRLMVSYGRIAVGLSIRNQHLASFGATLVG